MEDRRAGRSVIAGPAIVDGTLYWGAGHTHLALPMFTGNNKLYVFTLNGKYGWRQERGPSPGGRDPARSSRVSVRPVHSNVGRMGSGG